MYKGITSQDSLCPELWKKLSKCVKKKTYWLDNFDWVKFRAKTSEFPELGLPVNMSIFYNKILFPLYLSTTYVHIRSASVDVMYLKIDTHQLVLSGIVLSFTRLNRRKLCGLVTFWIIGREIGLICRCNQSQSAPIIPRQPAC